MTIVDLKTHPKPFVTVAELIDYTEVPKRTMYHHIEKGVLKAVKIGGCLKIPIEEARRYVKGTAPAALTTQDPVKSGVPSSTSHLSCATGT
jgi:excisionase family DNA binding protein